MALTITYVQCPENKYSIKCPFTMTPKGVTVHETYNDASAMNEISYMLRNDYQTSFHFAVDETRAVQGIPLNRNAWHSGDGANGKGNRETIAIETCYSKSGGSSYDKAFDNTLTLVAKLLKQYGWTVNNVHFHNTWSGKYCPHRTLASGITLAKYRKLVQARYDELYGTKTTTTTKPTNTSIYKYKLGETVNINGVYTSSGSTKKLVPDKKQGKITRIVTGAKNPYLLDNGNIGWVNEKCITGKVGATTTTPKPATSTIVGKTLYLPATVSHWNVYPLTKAPVVGNECGALNPKLFGGLSYKILANPQANVVTISTYNYGKVNIYVGSDTPAVIK